MPENISGQTLDLCGLRCPLPILKTKKALANMQSGEVLTIWATDVAALDDFAAFCRQTGHQLLSSEIPKEGVFELVIKHR